VREQCIALGV